MGIAHATTQGSDQRSPNFKPIQKGGKMYYSNEQSPACMNCACLERHQSSLVRRITWGVKLLCIALLLTCSFMIKTADCQVLYGSINGTVTDSTGAVVSGATVTATQTETNISRTETTNGSGFYLFASLPAGTYRIAIARAG